MTSRRDGRLDRWRTAFDGVSTWRSRLGAGGMALAATFLVFVATDARRFAQTHTGDTDNLVRGSRVALDCLRQVDLVACGHIAGSRQTRVFPYPLLQYIPTTFFVWIRLDDETILTALRWLSFAAVVAILSLFAWMFRSAPRLVWLSWPILIGSSLLYHANSAFGEAISALAVVVAVAGAAGRKPGIAGVAAMVACLGKETLAPFVAALALVCARDEDRLLPPLRLTLSIVGGSLVGAAAGAMFNVFRFGSPRNLLYLDPRQRTPGFARQIEWFIALWGSPAGGLLWFWTGLMVVVGASLIVAIRKSYRLDRVVGVAPTATLTAYLVGLALWYSPFGWITFGPRLAVPLLPAILFTVLWTRGREVLDLLGRTRSVALVVIGVVVIASVPMYGAPWRYRNSINALLRVDTPGCPAYLPDLDLFEDSESYFRCISHVTWRLRPSILDETISLDRSIAGTAWVLAVIGCGVMLAGSLLPMSSTDAATSIAATQRVPDMGSSANSTS